MKYLKLDEAILAAVKDGQTTYMMICGRVKGLANEISPSDTFRLIDRRLQRLRKDGWIKLERKEWRPTA